MPYTLTKQDIHSFIETTGLNNSFTTRHKPYVFDFIDFYEKAHPEMSTFIGDFKSKFNLKNDKRDSEVCDLFSTYFDGKITLPQDSMFFNLFTASYEMHKSHTHTPILKKIAELTSQEEFFELIENALLNYNPQHDINYLYPVWFKLAPKFNSPEHHDKSKAIGEKYFKVVNGFHKNSQEKTQLVKILFFLHQFEDQTEKIKNCLEKYQEDALFLKNATTFLEKNNFPIPEWNEKELKLVTSESISGKLKIHHDFFLKNYGFNRTYTPTFLEEFCEWLNKKEQDTRATPHHRYIRYETGDIHIYAKNIEQYSELKTVTEDSLNKLTKLCKHWSKDTHLTTFFDNYLHKVDVFDGLNQNLSTTNKPVKRNKI